MSINKVGLVPYSYKAISFCGDKKETEYENPVSRGTEKNLAILKSVGIAAVIGAVAGGVFSCFGLKNKKMSFIIGFIAGGITLALNLPASIYNAKVNAFARQKEMDVFSRDRNLKTNLTESVDKEVQDEKVSLDKKLDDNLKLQTANRGSALVVTGINSQPQEVPQAKNESK